MKRDPHRLLPVRVEKVIVKLRLFNNVSKMPSLV